MMELKPCPFCGKPAQWYGAADYCDIGCETGGCYLDGGAGWAVDLDDHREVAIHEERWNRRTPPDTPSGEDVP